MLTCTTGPAGSVRPRCRDVARGAGSGEMRWRNGAKATSERGGSAKRGVPGDDQPLCGVIVVCEW